MNVDPSDREAVQRELDRVRATDRTNLSQDERHRLDDELSRLDWILGLHEKNTIGAHVPVKKLHGYAVEGNFTFTVAIELDELKPYLNEPDQFGSVEEMLTMGVKDLLKEHLEQYLRDVVPAWVSVIDRFEVKVA